MAFDAGGEALSSPSEQAIGPYVHAVQRHWRLVALITLIALVVAGITVERAAVTYSASASILVTPLPEGGGFTGIGTVVDSGDPARNVQTAAALIDTPEAAAAAAKKLGAPWTTQSVLRAVSVTPRGSSAVLAVTAQAPSAIEAQRLANDFANRAVGSRASVVQGQIQASIDQLEARLRTLGSAPAASAEVGALATAVEQLRAVQGTGREPTMSTSQTAVSATANGASKALVLLLAIVGGFAIGSIAALGLETFSRPVRDREEITSLYPVPVLAAIPMIGGGRRAERGTPPWALPPDVFEQLRMLRVQLSLSTAGQVIMVTSAGAQDGKTTVATALAAAFAEADKSVILMDLDLRKPDVLRLLGVDSPASNGTSRRPPNEIALPVPRLPGVSVMPAPPVDIANFESVVDRLPMLLAEVRRTVDVVIIDTAPVGEVSEGLRIAPICDQVVFVARPRHTDRRRLVLARDLLERAGAPPVGLVLVGKETGMPRGQQSYAYAMSQRTQNGQPTEKRHSGVSSVPADAADRFDLD